MRRLFACLRPLAAVALLAIAVPLAGCAGAGLFGSNPQGEAGLSHWQVDFNEDGSLAGVEVVDGKEKQNVRLAANIKDGTVEYTATNVSAFEAFKSRADVEQYVAGRWPELAPDIRTGIVDIIGFLAGAGGG